MVSSAGATTTKSTRKSTTETEAEAAASPPAAASKKVNNHLNNQSTSVPLTPTSTSSSSHNNLNNKSASVLSHQLLPLNQVTTVKTELPSHSAPSAMVAINTTHPTQMSAAEIPITNMTRYRPGNPSIMDPLTVNPTIRHIKTLEDVERMVKALEARMSNDGPSLFLQAEHRISLESDEHMSPMYQLKIYHLPSNTMFKIFGWCLETGGAFVIRGIKKTLKAILEDETITKVFFNTGPTASCLKSQFRVLKITLAGVHDLLDTWERKVGQSVGRWIGMTECICQEGLWDDYDYTMGCIRACLPHRGPGSDVHYQSTMRPGATIVPDGGTLWYMPRLRAYMEGSFDKGILARLPSPRDGSEVNEEE
jgi:hypothetical protein